MIAEVDSNSGFCGGVIRAITTAEKYQAEHGGRLYSLGAIVHNEEELARLESLGIVAIDKDDLDQLQGAEGETLLVRAHGEPPEVYRKAAGLGFKVIDCTCPVVLKLQRDIKETFIKASALPVRGQILLYGKRGHPEVLGLVGQVEGDVPVLENAAQMRAYVDDGTIDVNRPAFIFSQTTMSPVAYEELCGELGSLMKAELSVFRTVCSQVAGRHRLLAEFARSHDVVVFVSGKTSSNGKVLCDLCRSVNIRTFHISKVDELNPAWFRSDDKVGVCGATSTPRWLLEKVAAVIENLQ